MVKASDSKSDGVSPRRFESCPLRPVLSISFCFVLFLFVFFRNRSPLVVPQPANAFSENLSCVVCDHVIRTGYGSLSDPVPGSWNT